MIQLIGGLLLAGYLPGALVFRLPPAAPARGLFDRGERIYWHVMLSVAITLAIALGLAVLGEYRLERVLVGDALVACAAVLLGHRRWLRGTDPLRGTDSAAGPRTRAVEGAWLAVPAALIALCCWLYPPPAEYVLGGKDPGVYMNAGVQIAQRGNLVTFDPVVSGLPAEFRELFFPDHRRDDYYSNRFMGFFVIDPASGAVIDQFPHLYPVAVALAYDFAGLTGARYASLVLAALGVVSLFFLGARLAGRPAGAAAAAMLAIHVVQVWHARVPNSEILTQPLLLAGLFACAKAHQDDDRFFAPVAALLLGLIPFARFDGLLTLALVGAGIGAWWLTGGRIRAAFVLPLAALLVAFLAYVSRFLAPYAALPLIWISVNRVALGATLLAAAAVFLLGLRFRRSAAVNGAIRTYLPVAVAVSLVALAAYAWFLREPGWRLAEHDAYSLRMFGWYVHPAAIAAALAGLVLLARRAFWRDPAFFVVAAGTAIFFFYRIRIVPQHFWASRRFVPILLPAVLLCLGAALLLPLAAREDMLGRATRWARYALRLALLALVVASFWRATAAILAHVEYAGVIPRLEQLAARFGDDDLVVVESRNSSDLHVLALPLAYIYNRPVLVLTTPKPDRGLFAAFIGWAQTRYRHVYFLGGGGTDLLSRHIAVEAVTSDRFQVPEYESPRNAYPTRVRFKEFDFGLYRFVPAADDAGAPVDIDIGMADDLHVVRFHGKERDHRGTYRWTRDVSYLALAGVTADARALVLWMENGGRPPQAAMPEVEVTFGETVLGRVRVGQAPHAYTLAIPADAAAAAAASAEPVTVRLRTPTWNPRAALGVGDGRDLGVMVDRVEVRGN